MRSTLRSSASAISVLLLAVGNSAASAQSGPAETSQVNNEIIVTADRAILAALRGIQPDRSYDDNDVQSYGSSTVGEFIDEVMAQNGDSEAVFLVNGELVTDIDDIADFPPEAVRLLEVLPRGSSQRVGGKPNQRVYNIVLKKQVRSATMNVGYRAATEGDWAESRAEVILTRISGRDRLNLSLRIRDSDALFESDRDIVQPAPRSSAESIGLADNADLGDFRTLRPDTRNYEANLSGSNRLLPWLSTTFSLRGRTSRDTSANGLPNTLLVLPASHPAATGGSDLLLFGYGSDALMQRYKNDSLNANLLLNATQGRWQMTLAGQYDLRDTNYDTQRQKFQSFGDAQIIPDTFDPFIQPLDPLFAFSKDSTGSRNETRLLRLSSGGPLFTLPAGDLRGRFGGQLRRDSLIAWSDTDGTRTRNRLVRNEAGLEAGLDIPLASRRQDFLGALGELSLTLDHSISDVRNLGTITRSTVGTLWQPVEQLSFTGSYEHARLPPPVETLADPLVITDNVRVLDVLTGETVDVRYLTGGNPGLSSTTSTTRRFAVSGAPWPAIALQLRADYQSQTTRDFISFLPPASPAVLAAFPDRFLRDSNGRLVSIDSRPVNFDHHKQEELRYGFSFSMPVGRALGPSASNDNVGNDESSDSYAPLSSGTRSRVQVTASHTVIFTDKVVIRDALAPIDLLQGGAIGIGGGRSRHLIDGSVAFTNRGNGIRLAGQWRSASKLVTGTSTMPQDLRFAPIATFNLRVFTDVSRFAPEAVWLKSTRLTFSVNNIANQRQSVRNMDGVTPLRYQPGYRDSIGRTVELEIRKVF